MRRGGGSLGRVRGGEREQARADHQLPDRSVPESGAALEVRGYVRVFDGQGAATTCEWTVERARAFRAQVFLPYSYTGEIEPGDYGFVDVTSVERQGLVVEEPCVVESDAFLPQQLVVDPLRGAVVPRLGLWYDGYGDPRTRERWVDSFEIPDGDGNYPRGVYAELRTWTGGVDPGVVYYSRR